MKTYYGLRMVSIVFLATSIVVSIITVATVGGLWGMSMMNETEFNNAQALIAIMTGGVIAIVAYAFGQLIDLQLNNHKVAAGLVDEIKRANELNSKTVKLLKMQLRIMHVEFDLEKDLDMRRIEKQIEERRDKLS